MKRLELIRTSKSRYCTYGTLNNMSNGLPLCHTMELPWVNNEKGISCIPTGIYKCIPYVGTNNKRAFKIQDVPSRTDILIHIANIPSDLSGCIAPGMKPGILDSEPAVLESGIAMEYLEHFIGSESFELIIREG